MKTCEVVQCQRLFKGKCDVNLKYAIKDCPAGVKYIESLEAQLQTAKDLVHDAADAHAEMKARIRELEEIETDLNNTIGFMERGVSDWKEKAERLETQLDDMTVLAGENEKDECECVHTGCLVNDRLWLYCPICGLSLPCPVGDEKEVG